MSEIEKQYKKYPPTNDMVFKKLFGEDTEDTKKALAFLINEIVGFKGKDRIKEIRIMNPYTVSDITKKRAILDIKARADNGTKYNVEMQVNKQDHYSARALYYWAKLYAEDLPEGDNYNQLSKTIGIHILDFECYEGFHLYKKHNMRYEDDGRIYDSFNNIEMHTIELPKLQKKFTDYDNIIRVIAAFLKDPEFIVKNRDKFSSDKLAELERLSSNYKKLHFTKEERDGFEERLKGERDERSIRDTIAREEREKGRKEGREDGEIKKAIAIARNLLKTGVDKEIIVQSTGLSLKEIEKLKY